MELKDQVCTSEHGKKLRELGVTLEPIFNHCVFSPDPLGERYYYGIHWVDARDMNEGGEIFAPAFNVAEVGYLLPAFVIVNGDEWFLERTKHEKDGSYFISLVEYQNGRQYFHKSFNHSNEVVTLTDMLIYLLTNDLHTL